MKLLSIDQYPCETEVKFAVDGKELLDIVGIQNRSNGKAEFRAVEKFEIKIPKPNINTKGFCEAMKKLQASTTKSAHDLKISGYKVIFNPPATILITPDGKKYVSKAHLEKFDEEKGLLMCLAKANGITHLDLKKMIKNAKRPIDKSWGEVDE